MSTTKSGLKPVTKDDPCEGCGKPDWCSRSEDGELVVCKRTESDRPARNGQGWLHFLGDRRSYVPRRASVRIEPPPPDLRPITDRAIQTTPAAWLAALACSLRLPTPAGIEALRRLGAHRARYDADDVLRLSPRDDDAARRLRRWSAWIATGDVAAFPMWCRGRVVGVRTRDMASANKMALPGGREGLFVPSGLANGLDWLAVTEGPTDTAALLSLGIETIGRPNCSGAADETVRLVLTLRPRAVALVLDRDESGICGGVARARRLTDVVDDVRCVLPPAKDARTWAAAGATRDDVLAAIARARCVQGGRHVES